MSLDSILVEEESETERVAQGKLIAAMAKILTAFDFDVQFSVKDGHVRRQELKGDSGRIYHPDLIASKGPWKIVCQARTRGQRGQSDKLDPGAVQFAIAELADLQSSLKRPHAMLITPHGIQAEARKLADHFGIIVAILPLRIANQILILDILSEKLTILKIVRQFGLSF